MISTRFLRLRKGLMMFGLMSFLITQFSPHRSEMAKAPASGAQQSGWFIAAFELSEENGFNFTWPHEFMRPAPYEAVVMVVEKMPRVLDVRGRNRRSRPLLASRYLKINNRLQKPLRASSTQDGSDQVKEKETFLVRLDQGRLHLELTIPTGTRFDPQHRTTKIKLYEAAKNQN